MFLAVEYGILGGTMYALLIGIEVLTGNEISGVFQVRKETTSGPKEENFDANKVRLMQKGPSNFHAN